MKTAIKLVLVYFVVQLISAFAIMITSVIYNVIQDNPVGNVSSFTVAFTASLAMVIMGVYLWKEGYISTDKNTWSPVSVAYLMVTTLACLAAIVIIEYLLVLMPWLPDLMGDTFDTLQSGWLGILTIILFGPVLEELLFRGAITSALLKKYSPSTAIILSALVFGIIHINPVQVVAATLLGLLLAWIYFKTASLIPCILIHIINNTLSVYLSLEYPETEHLQDLFTGNTYYIVLIAAIVLFAGSILWMSGKATHSHKINGSINKEIQ